MNQVSPFPLWIGHAGEGRDFRKLFDCGIQAVVDLALEEAPTAAPRELIAIRIPLVDGTGNRAAIVHLAVRSLVALLEMHVPTLVVCSAGMSRAPAIAAAALSLLLHEAPEECLKRIIEHRPHDVSSGFWTELTAMLASIPQRPVASPESNP